MKHLTIHNGHTADIPPPAPFAIAALRPVLAQGGGDLGELGPDLAGVRLTMCGRPWAGAASWDIARNAVPVCLCVFCATASASARAWAGIESVYLRLSDQDPALYAPGALPPTPPAPWLTTLLLMPGAAMCMDMMPWLADFNQCVAFAVAEECEVSEG
jgi:hypothetical protein